MKIAFAQIVAGKAADVVLKVADFANFNAVVEAAIASLAAFKSVGIVARNPVNKKEHVMEVNSIIAHIENLLDDQQESKGEVVEMRTVEVVRADIAEVKEAMKLVEASYRDGKIKHHVKVKKFNQFTRDMEALDQELYILVAAGQKPVQVPVLSAREQWAEVSKSSDLLYQSGVVDYTKYMKNGAFKVVADNLGTVREKALASMARMDMLVHQIVPFAQTDRQGRIGHIIFQVPAGLLQVKQWDGSTFVWIPMEEYDYNGLNSSRARLTFGSGFLKLAIKENADGIFVSWPKSKGKDDVFYDVFKTADVRYGIFHSDNNYNVQAALTAFVQTFWAEFKQANPRNRFGFNEHCGNCRHMVYLPIHDQLGEEYENKANPVDTSELSQWGNRIPQWMCGIHKDFTDGDAIDDLNEATSFEVSSYIDEEGNPRYLRAGQVLIKGKPVYVYNVRAEGTVERSARCPFYAKNERKPDQTITKEKEAVSGGYVSNYWTDRARAERMPIFTLHNDQGKPQWDLGFPGEFNSPMEFCVQGIGGIHVFGTPDVMALIPKTFVATTEAYKEDEAQIGKLINIIHSVCNQFVDITPETLDALVKMIQTTPRPVKEPLVTRYQRTLDRLAKTIEDNQ